MKNISLHVLIFLLFTTSFTFSSSPGEPQKEVLILIKNGFIDLPHEYNGPMNVKNIKFNSNALKQLFDSFNVTNIVKAFPYFEDKDTIKILPDGKVIQIPIFSRDFKIQLKNSTKVE